MAEQKQASMADLYGTDSDAEVDGVWSSAFPGKISLKLARAGDGNPGYKRAMLNYAKTKGIRQINQIDPDSSDEFLKGVYCKHIVKDWKGVKDAEGGDVAFSTENLMTLFEDYPDFWADVREAATNRALFQAEETEELAGN